jgi:hypothetical protein
MASGWLTQADYYIRVEFPSRADRMPNEMRFLALFVTPIKFAALARETRSCVTSALAWAASGSTLRPACSI